jgi:exo-1,4-beta-D-glucosaminidase
VGVISTYANLTGLNTLAAIPSSSISVTASTATQAGPAGADRATTVTITNNSSTVAFLVRADVRRGTGTTPAAGDNELQSAIWQNNDVTLFPGESQTIVATWNSVDLQGLSPVISVSGWNTATQNVGG